MLGKLDIHVQKNSVLSLPHTIYKNSLKCIRELSIRSEIMLRRKQRCKLLDISVGDFWVLMLKAKATKANSQVELYQTKKLLHGQGNHQRNKSATYQIGENTDSHQYPKYGASLVAQW